jgi:hypothetical protein
MELKKIAVIVRDLKNQWEGLRSSLGLGVEMIDTHMFVIGKVQMPDDRVEGYKENLEYLKDDLEAEVYTDNKSNLEKWGFFDYMPLDRMGKKLCEYDLIIPF